MEEYKKYLAECLFTEDKMVTYRTLSRALEVHVNTAKEMLYEFHRWQNEMSQGKVHAAYLVYGVKKPDVQADGDVEMASSAPEWVELGNDVPSLTLTLVTEDRLKDVLATYETVSSFSVYSLSAHPTQELQLLSDVSRGILEHSHKDHTYQSKTYGTIPNPNMKKRARQGKRPAPAPTAGASKIAKEKPVAAPAAPATSETPEEDTTMVKEEPQKQEITAKNPSSAPSSKKAAPPASSGPKKGGIMSAFSKAAAAAPKRKAAAPATQEKEEEAGAASAAAAMSDDGEDDDAGPLPAPKRAPEDSARQPRKDREAELRRMMEEESDEEDKESDEEKEELQEDELMEEAPETEVDAEAETKKEEPEPTEVLASAEDGRRRGKRRVMKKKQAMDEQGYLVTIQEQGWESFSEDEAPAPAPKPKPSSSSSTPASSGGPGPKPKKSAAKGQGNIMSFFSKK